MERKLDILLVEDNHDLIRLFQREFGGYGHNLIVACSIAEAIKAVADQEHGRRFVYALVDIHLGSGRDSAGLPILRVIRELASHRTLVCALTGDVSEETLKAAMEAGARIIFPKPISPHVLRIQFEGTDLEEMIHRANHSKMTNLLNYDRFEEMVLVDIRAAVVARDHGAEMDFCLLSMDADDFGRINKIYSHKTGDTAIKIIGRILEERFRFGDWICHKSGDEFLIWLRNTKLETALQVVATLEQRIATAEVRHSDERLIPISISAGVAQVDINQVEHLTDQEKVLWIMEQAEEGPYGLKKVKERKKLAKRQS